MKIAKKAVSPKKAPAKAKLKTKAAAKPAAASKKVVASKKDVAPKKGAAAKPAKPVKAAKAAATPAPVKVAKVNLKEVTLKSTVVAVASASVMVKGVVTKETIAKKTRSSIRSSVNDSGKKAAETLSRLKGGSPTTSISMAGAGDSVCREVACEGLATTSGYCRLHYIKNWKRIKRKELILKEKKLNRFIEELVAKYPDKYIEVIRQDLTNDKDFNQVISDLDIDESPDDVEGDGENVEAIIDNIKRDFEDDDTGF